MPGGKENSSIIWSEPRIPSISRKNYNNQQTRALIMPSQIEDMHQNGRARSADQAVQFRLHKRLATRAERRRADWLSSRS